MVKNRLHIDLLTEHYDQETGRLTGIASPPHEGDFRADRPVPQAHYMPVRPKGLDLRNRQDA